MIGALLFHIRPLLISGSILVNPFPVHPFIKGTAMIENSVQNHTNSSLMRFRHQLCKKLITCLQVFLIGNPVDIAGSKSVFMLVLS